MPIPLTLNNVTYQYPRLGDENWGQDATNWAVGATQLINSIDSLLSNTIIAGQFDLADGSAFTPSLRFQNSLTSGLFRAGSDIIGFSTNGSQAGTINSSGLWTLNDLSVTGGTSLNTLTVSGLSTLPTVSFGQLEGNGYIIDQQATSTLTDNSTGNVFTFLVASTKNLIVDYSLTRVAGKETGQLIMSTDGTNVQVSGNASAVVECGVSFTGDIDSGNIRLRYTTTSTGSDATMRYAIKRWND